MVPKPESVKLIHVLLHPNLKIFFSAFDVHCEVVPLERQMKVIVQKI